MEPRPVADKTSDVSPIRDKKLLLAESFDALLECCWVEAQAGSRVDAQG